MAAAPVTGKIAIIGLGRMGSGIVKRLTEANIPTVVWNRSPGPVGEAVAQGAMPAESFAQVVEKLTRPRIVWSMLPQGDVTEETLTSLHGFLHLLESGDIMIDGGNANYHDSVRRAEIFAEKDIYYLDVGTSGGLVGAEQGYCLMVGGDKKAYESVEHIFAAVAQPEGYGYIGPSGSGHFVKMVHNAIEYGMMQAYGEGLELVEHGPYDDINLVKLVNIWNHGSIVESFLGRTIEAELKENPNLDTYSGEIGYTGEAKWAIVEADAHKVEFPAIKAAMQARIDSMKTKSFANKVVAAMRHGFGGHTNKERS